VTLTGLWANLLGQNRIGVHDNFFELGGHSLLAIQLIARVRDTFQVDVPLRSIFEIPTIAGLAASIEVRRFLAPDQFAPIAATRSDQVAGIV
jgi:acyl carrier protein